MEARDGSFNSQKQKPHQNERSTEDSLLPPATIRLASDIIQVVEMSFAMKWGMSQSEFSETQTISKK